VALVASIATMTLSRTCWGEITVTAGQSSRHTLIGALVTFCALSARSAEAQARGRISRITTTCTESTLGAQLGLQEGGLTEMTTWTSGTVVSLGQLNSGAVFTNRAWVGSVVLGA
jgi:hypothetical protein